MRKLGSSPLFLNDLNALLVYLTYKAKCKNQD